MILIMIASIYWVIYRLRSKVSVSSFLFLTSMLWGRNSHSYLPLQQLRLYKLKNLSSLHEVIYWASELFWIILQFYLTSKHFWLNTKPKWLSTQTPYGSAKKFLQNCSMLGWLVFCLPSQSLKKVKIFIKLTTFAEIVYNS
jgi:hypothetical protein